MIQEADIHQGKCLAQVLRQSDISLAGFSDSRRVIVGKDQGRCMMLERGLYDLPRIDRRLAQRAPRHFVARDQPESTVEVQRHAVFNRQMSELGDAISFDAGGLVKRLTHPELFFQRTAPELADSEYLAGFCFAEPWQGQQARGICRQKPAQATAMRDELMAKRDHVTTLDACSQDNGQQFRGC